jgi:hypothetical protein
MRFPEHEHEARTRIPTNHGDTQDERGMTGDGDPLRHVFSFGLNGAIARERLFLKAEKAWRVTKSIEKNRSAWRQTNRQTKGARAGRHL